MTVLGRTDFKHPILSIISSHSCFIEIDFLQKLFLLLGHEKNVICSKLVSNPFNKYFLCEIGLLRIRVMCVLDFPISHSSIEPTFFSGQSTRCVVCTLPYLLLTLLATYTSVKRSRKDVLRNLKVLTIIFLLYHSVIF